MTCAGRLRSQGQDRALSGGYGRKRRRSGARRQRTYVERDVLLEVLDRCSAQGRSMLGCVADQPRYPPEGLVPYDPAWPYRYAELAD